MPQPPHMLLPDIMPLQGRAPSELLDADDLLVVIGAPGAPRAPFVRELIAQALPSLAKSHHYLKTHAGFLDREGTKPYVVVAWDRPGANALERRWVGHKLSVALTERYSAKRRTVLLEEGAGAAEIALSEDLLTREGSPRYDRSLLSGSRLIAADPNGIRMADPHRAARTRRQLQFRAWVNENPDELTSIAIGERLGKFCREHDCHFEALEQKRLAELGMNLLLAVGQASTRSPSRLFIATHNIKPGDRPLMLIGKGITFDTGGINLKPHEGFVNCMKNDMGGAGLMAAQFMALVESGYPGPLAVVIPSCENLIGEGAMKPGAVIKSYAGKDVLIEHTDAEGRLILADAIHYAQKQLSPSLTLVAATLTTASLRQFTNFFTAVHFAPEAFKQALTAAGSDWGEQFTFWDEFLPFAQGNKSAAADLTNMGRMPKDASMGGSCNVAAHFLKEFAVAPLVHFDIFASTWNWSGDYPGAHYGATGAPFNSLFAALRGLTI